MVYPEFGIEVCPVDVFLSSRVKEVLFEMEI